MTQNLYATQQSVLEYLATQIAPVEVIATEYPEADNPIYLNGVMVEEYVTVRFNDKVSTSASFAGPRHDEGYTLFDTLSVASTEDRARQIAWGAGGVNDILEGFSPVDAGPLEKRGSGTVFARGDGSTAKPEQFLVLATFRCQVNMVTDGAPSPAMAMAADDLVRSPDYSIRTIVTMTQAEYDAIIDPDPTQLIVIIP